MKNFLIVEDIPSYNKGEGALFFGIYESLKQYYPQMDLKIISVHPEEDRKWYSYHAEVIDANGVIPSHFVSGLGGKLHKLKNYFVFFAKHIFFFLFYFFVKERVFELFSKQLWKEYIRTDVVVAAHDSTWTPFYHGFLIYFFKLLGKKVVVYGATILPARKEATGLLKRLAETVSCAAVAKADVVTIREDLSLQALRDAGYSGKAPQVLPDLALLMKAASSEVVDELIDNEKIPTDRPLIGMTYSRRVLRRFENNPDPDQALEKACAVLVEVVDRLVDQLDVNIVFIPHSIGPTNNLDDRLIAKRIAGMCANKGRVFNAVGNYDPRAIKGLCSRLTLSVGTRLHFSIDSLMSGVPVLLLAYANDIRCHGIMKQLFPTADYIFKIEDMTADNLHQAVVDLFEKMETHQAQVNDMRHKAIDKASENGKAVFEVVG